MQLELVAGCCADDNVSSRLVGVMVRTVLVDNIALITFCVSGG